jgi:hypothetical protein
MKPTKANLAAAQMPPLPHSVEGAETFDITKSQAAQWLAQQPEILQAMFHFYVNSGSIWFSKETKTWQGSNYNKRTISEKHSTDKNPVESSGEWSSKIHSTPPASKEKAGVEWSGTVNFLRPTPLGAPE